jgi:NAD(P)-dependent dehydrogenase (short-subunit alcohol dehydrogenase family)
MEDYKDIFDLRGKKAVVTGGGSGIGQAIAWGLASFGADVMIAAHDMKKAGVTADGVEYYGVKAVPYAFEVTKLEEVDKLMADAVKEFGTIDILVNSAGKNIRKYILDMEEADWDTVHNINLKGTVFCCKAAAKYMIERKSGKIVNISSISSMLGHPARCAYAGSKGGLNQVTRVMATEWAPYNINVNCISPAAIDTPFIKGLKEDKTKLERELKRIPLGRIGQSSDIIGASVFLASKASDFITGHNLVVDGGRTVD